MINIKCNNCNKEFDITNDICPYCGDKVKTSCKFLCGKCENKINIKEKICKHCNEIPKEIIIAQPNGNRIKTKFAKEFIKVNLNKSNNNINKYTSNVVKITILLLILIVTFLMNLIYEVSETKSILSTLLLISIVVNTIVLFKTLGNYNKLDRQLNIEEKDELHTILSIFVFIYIVIKFATILDVFNNSLDQAKVIGGPELFISLTVMIIPFIFDVLSLSIKNKKVSAFIGIITSIILILLNNGIIGKILFIMYILSSCDNYYSSDKKET